MNSKSTCIVLSIALLFHAYTIPSETKTLDLNSSNKSNTKTASELATIKDEIVCVSFQEIVAKSEAGKIMQEKINRAQEEAAKPIQEEEKELQKKQKELQKTQTDLQKKQKDFQAKKDTIDGEVIEFEKIAKTLTEEARNKKISDLQARSQELIDEKRKLERAMQVFEDETIEFNRMQQKIQSNVEKIKAKIQSLYQKEMAAFDAFVKETIQEIALKEKWDLVVPQEAMIYAHPSKSKTQLVIAELDKKTKEKNKAKKQAIEEKNSSTQVTKSKL